MLGEEIGGALDAEEEAGGEFAAFEVVGHRARQLRPEGRAAFLVDRGVAEDGEGVRARGDEEEDAVAGGGVDHAEADELALGGGERVGDFFASDDDADLARGARFGGGDGGDDALVVESEVGEVHRGLPASARPAAAGAATAAGERAAAAAPGRAASAAPTAATPAAAPGIASPDRAAAMAAVNLAAVRAAGEKHEQDEGNDEDEEARAAAGWVGLRVALGAAAAAVFAAGGGDHGVHAGGEAGVEIAAAEVRGDFVLDDLLGEGVGQRAFEAIAGGDAKAALGGEDEKDRAVALALRAGMPRFENAHGVILERGVGLHLRENRDEKLAGGVALELRELGVQLLGGVGADEAGVIVEVILRRGRDDFGGASEGRGKREEGGEGEEDPEER